MGGGDLNLKKSWHPSTMKNMEKVWKAEQKHEQEKKKIAELQREIREEREREEIRKFAEDGGVIEKKDECKLDWMYKGPEGTVSREDYLLGRAIDKSFDLLQEAEASQSSSTKIRNNQGLPNQSGVLDDQVDIVRKLQEDPLLLIKRKEMETRSQLLNNPVKLKQLQKMLSEEKLKAGRKSKKKGGKRRKQGVGSNSSSSEEEEEESLDRALAAKYKRLRNRLSTADVSKLLSENEDRGRKKKEKKGMPSDVDEKSSSSSWCRHTDGKGHSKEYGLLKPEGYERRSIVKTTAISNGPPQKSSKLLTKHFDSSQSHRGPRKHLTTDEIEKMRMEMMDNARWREVKREENMQRQNEEERRERESEKQAYDTTFLRKQLSMAASVGTLEGRIKSNINNIQRSGRAMNKNFAKR